MELKFIPCAWHSEAELKCQSLEQRKVYCTGQARRMSGLYSWLKSRDGFQTMVKDRVRGRFTRYLHDQLLDLLLTDWWWGNRWCFRNLSLLVPSSLGICACSQHVVTIFHLGGGLSFYKTTQRYLSDCYLHSSRKKRVTEISDSIVLILNWNCSLELREGLGD